MTHIRPLLIVLALGGVLLPAARASDPEDPEWKVPAVTKVAVDLATVRHAEPDGPLPLAERFVATVTTEGRLHFGSAARYVAGEGDQGTGRMSLAPGQETVRSLQAFTEAVRQAVRKPGMRAGSGLARLRLLIRADRSQPWIVALWLMEAAAAPAIGVHRTQFAVQQAGAQANRAWRLPYELALDWGRSEGAAAVRECAVHLELDQGSDGRPALRVHEGFDASGTSTQRKLVELSVGADDGLDLDALAKALHAYRAEHGREGGAPSFLVSTLALTPKGAPVWTCGQALPILGTLRELGARVSFQDSPPAILPTPAQALSEGARTPFAGTPARTTRRTQRWDKAIDEALRWLVAHQSPSGAWEAAGFPAWCNGERDTGQRPDGAGQAEHDVGVTGLALLAFLGAGYTPRGEHPYALTVQKGLQYLQGIQDAEGCFGPRKTQHYIYDHGVATWAMVEAYGLTESPTLLGSAQRGLDFIAMCRNPYFAWRYGTKPGDNDTSVSGWMLMPLALARMVNEDCERRGHSPTLVLDEGAFDGVRAWLDKVTDPDYGRVGYIQRGGGPARPQALIDRFPGDKSEAMTGLGITLRFAMGEGTTRNRVIVRGLGLLERLLPTWNPNDGSIDMYYWYWGALATHQAGKRPWKKWAEALDKTVVPNQRKDTTHCIYRGSWDPIGPWGPTGGRVYSTALLALTLETPTRYARGFGR